MKWGLTKRSGDIDNTLDSFRKNMDRVFDDFFSLKPTTLFESEWLPTLDVEENDKAVHVKAEMPGINEKDLNVTLENNVLTISGEKKEEKEDNKKNYVLSERRFGSFSRSVTLPDGIKSEKIKAGFKNGILNIEIPKEETAKPKKISIEVK